MWLVGPVWLVGTIVVSVDSGASVVSGGQRG